MNKHRFNIFPEMSHEEKERLKLDIKQNGFDKSQPIYTYNNDIIDGWNRYLICKELNINPVYKEFIGNNTDAISFVMRTNKRRNLTSSQWAVIAIESESLIKTIQEQTEIERRKKQIESNLSGNKFPDKQENKTSEKIAKIFNTNSNYIKQVQKIKKENPVIYEEIKTGKKTITEANKEIKKIERQERIKELESNTINIKHSTMKLLEGNFFDKINEVENNSIDLLLVDPPYFMNKEEWDSFNSDSDFIDFTKKWINYVIPKLKNKYNIFITFNQEYFSDLEIICRKLNLPIQSRLIWHYRNAGGKSNGKFMLSKTYEPILHIGNKELNFNEIWSDERFDVWSIAIPQSNFNEGKFHLTQKPIELFKRLIKLGSKENELVLDCFAGSGTTGVACRQLSRNCIMIEQEKKYCNIIKGRLNELE